MNTNFLFVITIISALNLESFVVLFIESSIYCKMCFIFHRLKSTNLMKGHTLFSSNIFVLMNLKVDLILIIRSDLLCQSLGWCNTMIKKIVHEGCQYFLQHFLLKTLFDIFKWYVWFRFRKSHT